MCFILTNTVIMLILFLTTHTHSQFVSWWKAEFAVEIWCQNQKQR